MSRIRAVSKNNFNDGPEEEWLEAKDPVKPADQVCYLCI